jgi:FkbM family methyltransferase
MIFTYINNLKNKGFIPKNILDIGANQGYFSIQLKEIWPELSLDNFHLIEADEDNYLNLLTTGFNIYMHLLGDEDNKIVSFYKTKEIFANTGNSIYKEKTNFYRDESLIEVKKRMITLDSLFKDKNIIFDFAKLDTQGSELDIIKGGKETLSTCKYIIIEVSLKHYNDGEVPLKDDIINFMAKMSYNNYEVIDNHIWPCLDPVGDIRQGDIFQEDIIFWK